MRTRWSVRRQLFATGIALVVGALLAGAAAGTRSAAGSAACPASAGCIAFANLDLSNGEGTYDLYLIRADGTGLRRLTHSRTASDFSPTWSPDGTKLAYRHELAHDGESTINVMDADGTGIRTLHEGISPAWSPDGERIAFAGASGGPGTDIFVIDVDGRGLRRLTRSPNEIDEYPAWSPDGRRIMFASTHGVAYSGQSRALWIMRADGSAKRRLTGGHYDMYPTWAPTGNRVAFHSDRGRVRPAIWTMTAAGARLRQLGSCRCEHPAWSPDGREIAAAGGSSLAIIRAVGPPRIRRIAHGLGEPGFPAWRP